MEVTSGQPQPLSASGLVKTGQGTLQKIICATSSSGTATVYDALTATGTPVLNAFPLTAGGVSPLDINFQIGCYIAIGGTATITATYGP